MNLSVLDARETEAGIAVTLVSGSTFHELEGTLDEMARLAAVMRQASVLAPLHEGEPVWLEDVSVGHAVVRLGLSPGGETRVLIVRS